MSDSSKEYPQLTPIMIANALPIVVTVVLENGKPNSRYYPDYNDLTCRRAIGSFVAGAITSRLKVITAPFDESNSVHQVLRRKWTNYNNTRNTTDVTTS